MNGRFLHGKAVRLWLVDSHEISFVSFLTKASAWNAWQFGVLVFNVLISSTLNYDDQIDVFPEERNNVAVNKKEFDGVIYLGRVPKVIFEINGTEHYKNKKRIASDKAKLSVVEGKAPMLFFIPNQYVKHYEFIRELMIKVKGGAYQKTLFDI